MDQRKRLIELITAAPTIDLPVGSRAQGRTYRTAQTIADYLLANGVIVPPVKVGDTVYRFSEDFGTVLPYFVENLGIGFMDKTRNYWVYEANCHDNETDELLDEIDFDIDDIGKTVFLTEKEAEKALAERSGSCGPD